MITTVQCTTFEELVDDIMSDWNSEQKVKEVLTYCYVNDILYSPKFNGESGFYVKTLLNYLI